ncbi:LAMI_0F09318g1_1 [Lachancea mirantina]|uniref:Protein YIP n=1 Tax=Lachancea mirantina TaxID=1230905 RepID=A0A1G4K1A0_9SACH|nr:LAMI_0F09318g1_1 [Lachancea mirantina]
MSFYNSVNKGNGFYQPSSEFQFPQGSMSFAQAPSSGTQAFPQEPLPTGLLNAFSTKGYPHELPLLEELGINFGHIITKTKIVLQPMQKFSAIPSDIVGDSDLAGPLIFCLLFGTFLLLGGKVHFGYIYGVALFGTISLHTLFRLMGEEGNAQPGQTPVVMPLQFLKTASILGYCFLPLCFLSLVGIFCSLNNVLGYVLGLLFVCWCTWSSSGFFTAVLQLSNARVLIAYPLSIFYSVFALMAIFV